MSDEMSRIIKRDLVACGAYHAFGWDKRDQGINAPMTDREMLHYVNGSLSAIEDMSMDRMKAAVVKLRADIKKNLGVE